ncbi:hypothetical protein DFO77_112107 [Marinilabilia salmonicolor]|jgi:hypothetical protein|uniref:Uncharacterized protein n=1 Tax=Marinilabilia salmonicolor TaxID=989 RepID=A0A368UZC9_9BACT|nr:hypothetical protein DFO77_112107 [Marinilabilia salmonicolor]
MATIASKENVKNQPCEFHQTNNLDKLFADETSMIFFKHKYHKRICLKNIMRERSGSIRSQIFN